MWLDFTASIAGVYQPLPSPALQPPDFEYSQWVVRGSRVYMALTPPPPYQRVVANRPEAQVDFVQDLPLSTLPGLIIWDTTHITEAIACFNGSLSAIAALLWPAPPGACNLGLRTSD